MPSSAPEDAAPQAGSACAQDTAALPPCAFIVEDDECIGHLLVFILEREGFRVEWKTSGKDAGHFIGHQEPPEVVLLDISLPDIDGYGLLRLIRASASWQGVPVLMLTAMSQAKDVATAVACGANDYLLKPFHPADLVSRVHKLLQG